MLQKYKRLFLLIVISVIVILLAKSLLGRTIKNLNVEVQAKQKAKSAITLPSMPASAPIDHSTLPDSSIITGAQAESAPVAASALQVI